MQIGRLRHKVTIQNPVRVADGKGGETETWTDAANVWAEIAPISSRERFYASQIDAEHTHKVIMRHTAALTSESRLLHDGRVLHVAGAPRNVDERNIMLEVWCKEEEGG